MEIVLLTAALLPALIVFLGELAPKRLHHGPRWL